jgi:hypothetical protein
MVKYAALALLLSCGAATAAAKVITVNPDNSTTERIIGTPDDRVHINCTTVVTRTGDRTEIKTYCIRGSYGQGN